MIFNQPLWLMAALLVLPILAMRKHQARIRVSSTSFLKPSSGSYALSFLPQALLGASIAASAITLSDPQIKLAQTTTTTTMGRDIILALDYSGSMAEPFKGDLPKRDNQDEFAARWNGRLIDEQESEFEVRRIEAAQQAILKFVDKRRDAGNGDSIGLIAFDNRPILRWPLDRDLMQISRHGNFVPRGKGPRGLGGGTNFGTKIPGPIDLAATHFEKKGRCQTRILILVTDGENEIDKDSKNRLEKLIADTSIRLYVIGVGESLKGDQADIAQLCLDVGGKVFRVERSADLDNCFAEIDSLESSPVPLSTHRDYQPVFYVFLSVAAACCALWGFSEAVISGR